MEKELDILVDKISLFLLSTPLEKLYTAERLAEFRAEGLSDLGIRRGIISSAVVRAHMAQIVEGCSSGLLEIVESSDESGDFVLRRVKSEPDDKWWPSKMGSPV